MADHAPSPPATGRPDPTAPLTAGPETPVEAQVEAVARRRPEALAIVDPSGAWSYGVLTGLADALATELRRRGVSSGDVVAVLAHRSAPLPLAILGVLRAGAAFTLLDPSYPAARIAACVAAVRPRALVALEAAGPVPDAVAGALRDGGCMVELRLPATLEAVAGALSRSAEIALPASASPTVPGRDGLAYVAFTSGTTGAPKAILGSPHGLPHFLRWQRERCGLSSSDRFSMLSGLAHDPLLRDVFAPLTLGATLLVPDPAHILAPERLLAWLWEEGVSVVHLTPSLARALVEGARLAGGCRLPGLRHVFLAGEPLQRSLVAGLRSIAPSARCVNLYGATETPQGMGWWPVGTEDLEGDGLVPVGRGIDDVQLLVVQAGRLAEPGEVGEIQVRTPYLARGYLGDAPDTLDRFVANPFTGDAADRVYRTGDLGRYRQDGAVEYAGRLDDQVKIRGFRVEPGEVEAVLLGHPAVAQVVVATPAGPDGERSLLAFALLRGQVTAQALRGLVAERLPAYMVPQEIVLVESFPLTPNGKVDRAALLRTRELQRREGPGFEAPRGEEERAMAAIWEELLGVHPVGRDDDFLDLGGHSLLALTLLARIQERFGRRLPLRVFVESGTVAGLVAAMGRTDELDGEASLAPVRATGSRPPLIWLPGGGGLSVMAFRGVSLRLGPDQPVYGIEAGLDLERSPADLPAIAAGFLRAIRRVHPHGPYHLLGFSLGSFVAWEIAAQLGREGEETGLLAVFDTPVPGHHGPLDQASALARRAAWWLGRASVLGLRGVGRRASMSLSSRLRQARRRLRSRGAGPGGTPAGAGPAGNLFAAIVDRNRRAVAAYAAAPLPEVPGRVTVFLAEETSADALPARLDERCGWGRSARGGMVVRRVPGNHLTMLEPPHVGALAEAVRAAMDEALDAAGRRGRP